MANPLPVSEVVRYVKRQLDGDPVLQQVAVIGEISNFKRYASGHCYFTLKDESSRMKAVMFARDAKTLTFDPTDGMNVIVVARVTMYESTGDVQLYVELMRQDGVGQLYERFEARKRELEAKGWFDDERKRPLPAFPERIGIVTSPKGAALHDIATTLRRRAPHVAITFAPVAVQGATSAPQVANAIRWMNERTDCDVLIVGRGGGSIEELWAFNEDAVVEAIFESDIPVISAVGHETDFTLADFVADVRAATPTAAAELATATIEAQRKDVERLGLQLHRVVTTQVASLRERVERMQQSYGLKSPRYTILQKRERFSQAEIRLEQGVLKQVATARHQLVHSSQRLDVRNLQHVFRAQQARFGQFEERLVRLRPLERPTDQFARLTGRLASVSPLAVLARGYTLVEQDGSYVKDVKQLHDGLVTIRFRDGHAVAEVKERHDGEETRRTDV
ncbi:exodeoxyribonuclease VII large subunit [Exiguobacterium alkaliphilum]|uniref:Exodeoxyribonuclease 7 large subunit n=1 Tax=Exiguobacterium alkaliphilum TaxID=1428684 RepID=A0ABT2L0Y3_9BACL|nr:exodeoxyribonuclease VII large subunit [Exiguobacterium alkaliphilum]MCT4795565.1 exodeoxyribonuclease VII large subunit [Exiguobacterium alkaliphilum]